MRIRDRGKYSIFLISNICLTNSIAPTMSPLSRFFLNIKDAEVEMLYYKSHYGKIFKTIILLTVLRLLRVIYGYFVDKFIEEYKPDLQS